MMGVTFDIIINQSFYDSLEQDPEYSKYRQVLLLDINLTELFVRQVIQHTHAHAFAIAVSLRHLLHYHPSHHHHVDSYSRFGIQLNHLHHQY